MRSGKDRFLNRRDLLSSGAVATAVWTTGSCGTSGSQPKQNIPRQRISILRHETYDQKLFEAVSRLIREQNLDVRGRHVVLKPNLVEFDEGSTINTHPLFVHAVLEAFRSRDAASVRIAEGPGHRRITMDLAEEAGYFRTIPGFEKLFVDLNLDRTREVAVQDSATPLRSLYLPETALGADLLVSLPKMKTHHWVGATLSMKNLFGLVPGGVYGWPKNILHWAGINESIAALFHLFPNTFAIVDGIEGMEGNGPIQGTPKHAGVVVAGADLAAVDATCCRIMGIDPLRLEYLNLAVQDSAERLSEPGIVQTGEPIRSVRTEFRLLPQFQAIRLQPAQAG